MYHSKIRFDRICGLLDAAGEPLPVAAGKEGENKRGDNSGGHREAGFAGEGDRYISEVDAQKIHLSLQENTYFTPLL